VPALQKEKRLTRVKGARGFRGKWLPTFGWEKNAYVGGPRGKKNDWLCVGPFGRMAPLKETCLKKKSASEEERGVGQAGQREKFLEKRKPPSNEDC